MTPYKWKLFLQKDCTIAQDEEKPPQTFYNTKGEHLQGNPKQSHALLSPLAYALEGLHGWRPDSVS